MRCCAMSAVVIDAAFIFRAFYGCLRLDTRVVYLRADARRRAAATLLR